MASDANGTAKASASAESSPLITRTRNPSESQTLWKPIHAVLFCAFLVSLTFGVTQVPLVYVFRLMTCDAYYETHPYPSPQHGIDKCSVPEIEAGTARAVSLLGVSTTFFGVINLFITGHEIKTLGVKYALAIQVFWPAARLAVQNVGVARGGSVGIIIVQCSQIITLLGGPAGYILALNTFVTELVSSKERTSYLGILQGCNMFGSAVGYLIGGFLADLFSIITPFQVTLALFLLSTCYVLLCLRYIAPDKERNLSKSEGNWLSSAFGPFKSIKPSKWVLEDGRIWRGYGPLILVCGVFLTVLATGYIPTLLQMYATDEFGFGTRRNSLLVSSHLFLRGVFLTLVFPRVIAAGRRAMDKLKLSKRRPSTSGLTSSAASTIQEPPLAQAMQDEAERDIMPPKAPDEQETYEFDLIYTQYSALVDGAVTFGATFIRKGWQMYLIGALLPLGAGTPSAAKGTLLQMCPPNERTDVLSALSLVELCARLATTFVFGLVFAAFATVQKTYLNFTANAAVALVGFAVLLLVRFPPEGSKRHEPSMTRNEDDE